MESLALLASRLVTSSNRAKDVVLTDLYGRLNLSLVRANVVANFSIDVSSQTSSNNRVHLFILLLYLILHVLYNTFFFFFFVKHYINNQNDMEYTIRYI